MDDLRSRLQTALGERYVLGRELGGGGMARIFLARETALGRAVVVKMLDPELSATMSAARFAREIRLTAKLQEPHIVPVLVAGQMADGLPYYTMPYVEGESLRARLDRGPLRYTEAIPILRDVARALAYAHAHGVVHRDIKPDNVLLSSGTAVVTDFGVAKAVQAAAVLDADMTTSTERLTTAGMSVGTPAYMAPEQVASDPATDHRADLYAFGLVAYEMLAGEHPFAHRRGQALLRAQLTEPPPPLQIVAADVPPALVRLIEHCLAKAPTARPSNASEVLRALDDIQFSGERPHLSLSGVAARAGAMRGGRAPMTLGAVILLAVGLALWRQCAGSPNPPVGQAPRTTPAPHRVERESAEHPAAES